MKTKFTYYFIPSFIIIYFSVSIVPFLAEQNSEIFPFSPFKLYSVIPNNIEEYDLLLNPGEENKKFLLKGNNSLTGLERKYFRHVLNELGKKKLSDISFPNSIIEKISGCPHVEFVKLTGDYLAAVKENKYRAQVILKLR